MTQNYTEGYEYLSSQFPEVSGYDFYREMFPNNERSDERHMDYSHPNAIYLYREQTSDGFKRMRRRIMFSDQWENDYMEFIEQNPLTLCSGLAYRGRSNKLEHAQRMNAMIFDLDGVGLKELRNLFLRFGGDPTRIRRLPMPTYLVLSGTGLHVCYFFREPIDLYPNIKIQLKSLKYDLTFRMWEYKATSQNKEIQYQSINQSFRMVGSINEKHGNQIVAFRTGEPVTLEYLNAYARPENRVDVNKPFRPSKITRAAAREAYPEWYERVIVKGEKYPKKWDIAGKVHGDDPYALYHWWLRQILSIRGGHRYFFLMCMAIYAYKCDVPKAQLRKDMQIAFEDLQMVQHENALTEDDIKSALEAYDREYLKNYQGEPPTLKNLYDDLMKQVNPEAHRIALALELFTVGSLNVFSHQTNINTKSRILCFDIQDLGENLKLVGLLVMLDAIYNRVIQNRREGKYTHVYIDEIYLFFANGSGSGHSITNYSSEFLYKCWKRFRKYGATLTGITQNVEECLLSNTARMMFANSEFLLMLNQATTDREQLARLLGASDTQMSYVDNAPAGHGLIKVGGAIVPFANELPKNTELYRLMSTRPGED